jgi:hypothetical protein
MVAEAGFAPALPPSTAPVKFTASSKTLISYKVTQKLYGHQVTVIVSATVNGRKTEARWSFNIGSNDALKEAPKKG